MASVEELLEQKRMLEQRLLGLQKYGLEIKRIWGEINSVTYRMNSDYRDRVKDIQKRESLKSELREKTAGLKEEYQVSPYRIPVQIRECESGISRIRMQIEELENRSMVQDQQPARQEHPGAETSLEGIAEGSRQIPVLAEPVSCQASQDDISHHSPSPSPDEGRRSGFDELRRDFTDRLAKGHQERSRDRGGRFR